MFVDALSHRSAVTGRSGKGGRINKTKDFSIGYSKKWGEACLKKGQLIITTEKPGEPQM